MNKRAFFHFFMLVILVLSLMTCSQKSADEFDILIINGRIIDGTGNPWFYADIGIKGDRITEIGNLSKKTAHRIIDAKGLVVSPGFIDMHTHCDQDLDFADANAILNYLIQGTTTVVTGNCGIGTFAIAETKERWDKKGLGTNVAHMVGFGTVRTEVLSLEPRAPSTEELNKMKSILKQAMQEGAWGMSTGLEYIPDMYASTEEVIEMTKVVGEFDGAYLTHQRDEDSEVVASTKEAIRIAAETGVRVNFAHFKALGKKNWGLLGESVDLINEARANGIYITADMYPYDRASVGPIIAIESNSDWSVFRLPHKMEPFASLRKKMAEDSLTETERADLKKQYMDALAQALSDKTKREQIRKSVLEGEEHDPSPVKLSGWYSYAIVDARKNTDLIGKILGDIAREQNRDAFDVMAELVIDEPDLLQSSGVMSDDDMKSAMKEDWLMFSSDGSAMPILSESGCPPFVHPRSFGSQARVLQKYVREDRVLTMENAIRKMTSLPAQLIRMKERGLLIKGYKADIAIFNPETIRENGTYAEPCRYSSGTEYVIVNGKVSIENGEYNGGLNGKMLLYTKNETNLN
ncbi:MAG: D-aminoacylase [Candidatus Aminicenantes bacterium]|nr:D-aminoacylase [Candidatus Aminicenantes bacterium]